MSPEQYNELMNDLNFHDTSVGINPISLADTETIKEILESYSYVPIGQYETKNSKGFKFQDENETYSIQEENDELKVYKLIEL